MPRRQLFARVSTKPAVPDCPQSDWPSCSVDVRFPQHSGQSCRSEHTNIADSPKLCIFRVMRFRAMILGLLALALGSGCATLTTEDQATVFREPSRFEGQEVYVCGRLNGTSNIHSARDEALGLSIRSTEKTAPLILQRSKNRGSACLRGIIEYIGCATDKEIICTDWAFDYAIELAEVR